MKLLDFNYSLPKNRIAQYPAGERDSSRLLVVNRKRGKIDHRLFRDITGYLHPGDVLVLNDTRVIPARIYGAKPTGGKVEILLIKEELPNTWEALVKGIIQGRVILKEGLTASVSRFNGTARVKFEGNIQNSLKRIGVMPLPPYIKRQSAPSDTERYQTVYAKKDGAIAAPTAGLHFTAELLERIEQKGVTVKKLTLHVGYGTFKPVQANDIKKHEMDEELYEIPGATADAINRAKSEGSRVIAVGTTVTRALEASGGQRGGSGVRAGKGRASIFIYPGYSFRVADALITNFHLPKSTTMMLTSAFSGLTLLKKAYFEALDKNYRFYSYGDAMLII